MPENYWFSRRFFIFVKIIFSLLKIIKAVAGSRSGRFGLFFVLLPFLVLCVQSLDILQSFYLFLFPALQDLVRILEAGLSCLQNCSGAGFLNDAIEKP